MSTFPQGVEFAGAGSAIRADVGLLLMNDGKNHERKTALPCSGLRSVFV